MQDDRLPGADEAGFYREQDTRLLGWLRESLQEGIRVNNSDPASKNADTIIKYIMGEQTTGNHPSYLHHVVVNQIKKSIRTHVSALTDMKPLFAFKTFNSNFQAQADLINQRTLLWWVNCDIDMDLADCIRYSLACGSGDMVLEWDPWFRGGDTRAFPRDPRDTLPIQVEESRSIQDWAGLTLREEHPVDQLRTKFPGEYWKIQENTGTFGGIFTKFRRMFVNDAAPPGVIESTRRKNSTQARGTAQCTLYRTFLQDRSLNLSAYPIVVGKPGTVWSYIVPPKQMIYPRGRLIVWTELGILFDGPNPYWHRKYPVGRLKLDPWPWLFMGLGLAHDLIPLQDILNVSVNDILSVFSQWVNRGSVWDSNMPESQFQRFDPRQPHWKVRKKNPASAGFTLVEGPQLPPWTQQFLELMFSKFDELSETANLQALMQLRQMPGEDTIQKYLEALTPGIRLEARQIEVFLRDVAEIYKGNLFQYESKAKRIMMLGDAGSKLQDFDYDPGNLIPALDKADPNYIPELDKDKPTEERAQFFMNQFAFYVAPNSILAMQAQERKLLYLQLSRAGFLDFWTLMEVLEIPNVGQPPVMPLPALNWKFDPSKPTQPTLEPRVPMTIMERLIAQQQLGIGMTNSPAGRKASGQEAPALKQQPDGTPTVTES